MAQKRQRMTGKARQELIRAIQADEIDNATQFAEDFAARRGLNPASVRSSISRLRRELGALKHPPGGRVLFDPGTQSFRRPFDPGVNAIAILQASEATEPIARLGAAVMVRYQNDDRFKRAVDEQRPEIEMIYRHLNELTMMLSATEKDDLVRSLKTVQKTLLGPAATEKFSEMS